MILQNVSKGYKMSISYSLAANTETALTLSEGIYAVVKNTGGAAVFVSETPGINTANAVVLKPNRKTVLKNISGGVFYALSATAGSVEYYGVDARTDLYDIPTANILETDSELSDLKGYIGYSDNTIYGIDADFENNVYSRISGSVGKNSGADFDNLGCWNRRRCVLSDSGVVLAYYGEAAYTETGALTQAVTVGGTTYPIGTSAQVMVEQPKFFYKVVPMKTEPNNARETDTLSVSSGATADGDITLTLGGADFTVSVENGDTAAEVIGKIAASSYTGWTVSANEAQTAAIFVKNAAGAVNAPAFSGGNTGVAAAFSRTECGYIGKGYKLRRARYYISSFCHDGFKVHPAFVRNGTEVANIYLSAYEGSLYDVSQSAYISDDAQVADFTASTGDKLSSVASAKPMSGVTQLLTRANARIIAANRGTGWTQAYSATTAATQLLFAVEYASFNTQEALGAGVVAKAAGTGNEAENTGITSTLGNASGTGTGTACVSYRGEENFWGNISTFIDGMNVYSNIENNIHDVYIADHDFTENKTTSPYSNSGMTVATKTGYISALAYNKDCDWLFLPAETLGSSSFPIGDGFTQLSQTNGYRIVRFGGSWNSGNQAGGFNYAALSSISSSVASGGSRLVYVPAA